MPATNLRDIRAFPDLVRYLEDELDWPLQEYGFDELTFEYTPAELGLKEEDAARVKAIHQLRPLASGQPWGIFFVEFENKKLPVVVLRRILSHLVIKKRASANKASAPAWHAEDLLFVTAFGEDSTDNREIAFAHFHQNPGDLPTLHVLGWDGGDTPLKLAHVDRVLHERLHWPENESDADAWRETWRKPFKHKLGHVIRTADMLAEELARLARGIRDKARRMLAAESDKGPLTKLYKAFQTALIHDLTPETFADTYAQTITYGLLTAAISRTEMSEGRHGTALLADDIANIVPVTNPFLKEMLQTFLKAGGRKGGIDFDELGIQDVVELLRGSDTDLPAVIADFGNKNPNEDPVIHFYEHFLAAYDKPQKKQRGVFYTPQPVVGYIVRSVHELLQTEFGLEDGLASTITWAEMAQRFPSPSGRGAGGEGRGEGEAEASSPPVGEGQGERGQFKIPEGTDPASHFVTILDPATGTATFLVEVINVIHRTLLEIWAKQGLNETQRLEAWNDYVPRHLLPRLYGYELMMAPYAIAHMKIGLKLFETGYRFGSDERVRVYLTNALEPAHEVQPQLEALAPALAHEAQAVADVKRAQRFTVVVGNPPYAKSSGNRSEAAEQLVKEYKQLVKGEINVQPLSDDYVKFIAYSLHVSQQQSSLVAMITNRSYLDGLIHRGLRQRLLSSCSRILITDLHGDSNVGESPPQGTLNDNVFDITQGVAVGIFVRNKNSISMEAITHRDLWGTRSEKYFALENSTLFDGDRLVTIAPYFFFVPKNLDSQAEQVGWISVDKLFGIYGMGVKSRRDHFLIDQQREVLCNRFKALADTKNIETLRAVFEVTDNPQWSLLAMRELVRREGVNDCIYPVLYRPFDTHYIWYHREAIERGDSRWPVMKHVLPDGISLLTSRQSTNADFTSVFIARGLSEMKTAENSRGSYAFPLFIREDGALLNGETGYTNIRSHLLAPSLRRQQPTDVLNYIYAILHAPAYRARYAAALKIEFPKIPAGCPERLFSALAQLGGELIALHLLESPKVNTFITRFEGQGDNSLPKKPTYKDGAVWINATQRFEGVPEAVWNFHVGGYQVCEKWLKDRKGRTLTAEDIAHYQRVVVALNETLRLMAEIDQVIETHGGWPGAFKAAGEGVATA